MNDLSRREKKLAHRTLDTIDKSKEREQLLSQNPLTSYKRKVIYTHMPWPLELIQMGRSDVLILIIVAIVLLIAFIAIVAFYGINWVIDIIRNFIHKVTPW